MFEFLTEYFRNPTTFFGGFTPAYQNLMGRFKGIVFPDHMKGILSQSEFHSIMNFLTSVPERREERRHDLWAINALKPGESYILLKSAHQNDLPRNIIVNKNANGEYEIYAECPDHAQMDDNLPQNLGCGPSLNKMLCVRVDTLNSQATPLLKLEFKREGLFSYCTTNVDTWFRTSGHPHIYLPSKTIESKSHRAAFVSMADPALDKSTTEAKRALLKSVCLLHANNRAHGNIDENGFYFFRSFQNELNAFPKGIKDNVDTAKADDVKALGELLFRLEFKRNPTDADRFEMSDLLWYMTHPDPKKRITMGEALGMFEHDYRLQPRKVALPATLVAPDSFVTNAELNSLIARLGQRVKEVPPAKLAKVIANRDLEQIYDYFQMSAQRQDTLLKKLNQMKPGSSLRLDKKITKLARTVHIWRMPEGNYKLILESKSKVAQRTIKGAPGKSKKVSVSGSMKEGRTVYQLDANRDDDFIELVTNLTKLAKRKIKNEDGGKLRAARNARIVNGVKLDNQESEAQSTTTIRAVKSTPTRSVAIDPLSNTPLTLEQRMNQIKDQLIEELKKDVSISRDFSAGCEQVLRSDLGSVYVVNRKGEIQEKISVLAERKIDLLTFVSEGGGFTEQEQVQLRQDLLEGMDCFHKKGVVLADVKPENIVIFRKEGMWRAQFIDFGLAYRKDDQTPVPYGSFPTFAPESHYAHRCHDSKHEQVRAYGNSPTLQAFYKGRDSQALSRPTQMSDIFSLGLVFYMIKNARRGGYPRMDSTLSQADGMIKRMLKPMREDRPTLDTLIKENKAALDSSYQMRTIGLTSSF